MKKTNKGITLIALVVTIVVLLILAGISIAMLSGDNGIIKKATSAKSKNIYSTAKEQMQLEYNGLQTKINIQTASDSSYEATDNANFNELVNLIKKDLGITTGNSTSDGKWTIDATTQPIITITYKDPSISTSAGANKEGKVVTKIRMGAKKVESFLFDYAWELTTDTGDSGLSVGDLITNKPNTTEQFYVIGFSEDNTKVKLLSKYNLNSDGTNQDTSGAINPCKFSDSFYWNGQGSVSDLNNYGVPDGCVVTAKKYGMSLMVTGRLMIQEEVIALGGNISDYSTAGCPDFVNTTSYWLGTAPNVARVNLIKKNQKKITQTLYVTGSICGIRPVVEVLKSEFE